MASFQLKCSGARFATRRYLNHAIIVATVSLLVGSAAVGQQQHASPVAQDEPELCFGFFSLHQAIQKDILARTDGSALKRAAAQHFNISEVEFDTMGRVASSVLAQLSALTQAAKGYYENESASGRLPDRTKLQEFNNQRLAILQRSMVELQAALPAASWTALHAYINDSYRSHVIRRELINEK